MVIRKKHGMAKTSTYNIWVGMKSRCFNMNNERYKDYGGRGIRVCERWITFQGFFEDMGMRPSGMTIERINNNGHYEPMNCKWASYKEQCNNSRRNTNIKVGLQTKTLKQWAELVGIHSATILQRINKGWNNRDAIFHPRYRRYNTCGKCRKLSIE